jgi:hypothetical protein
MPRATRTSTDDGGAEGASAGARRFRRSLLVTVLVLALACAGLGAAAILQGPKLRGSHLDTTAAVAGPGQQLRLVLNEAVAKVRPSQLRMTPAVPMTVQTQDSVVTVQLGAALASGTRYALEVRGVTSARGGPASTVRAEVTTPAFSFTYLRRGDVDRILTTTVGGATRQLYQATGIQWFVPVAGALVVATTTPDRESRLALVQPGSALTEVFTLPDTGRINGLTAVGDRVLFTLTSARANPVPTYDHTLFVIDLASSHTPQPVTGLDGKALDVDDWTAVPGTASIILHGIDTAIWRYSPGTGTPLAPLGTYQQLGGLAPDQQRLGVQDAAGALSLDLASGTPSPVTVTLANGSEPYADAVVPLDATHQVVRISAAPPSPGAGSVSQIVETGGTGPARVVAKPAGTAPLIIGYRMTGNGQYVVLEFQPDEFTYDPDSSPVNQRPTGVTTDVVELATGRVVAQVTGFDAVW